MFIFFFGKLYGVICWGLKRGCKDGSGCSAGSRLAHKWRAVHPPVRGRGAAVGLAGNDKAGEEVLVGWMG